MTQLPEHVLHQGIEALGLAMPSGAETRCLQYLALMQKWNREIGRAHV